MTAVRGRICVLGFFLPWFREFPLCCERFIPNFAT